MKPFTSRNKAVNWARKNAAGQVTMFVAQNRFKKYAFTYIPSVVAEDEDDAFTAMLSEKYGL